MKRIVKLIVVLSVLSLLVLPTVVLKGVPSGNVTVQGDPGGGIRP